MVIHACWPFPGACREAGRAERENCKFREMWPCERGKCSSVASCVRRGIPDHSCTGERKMFTPLAGTGEGAVPSDVGPYHALLNVFACARVTQFAVAFVPPLDVHHTEGSVVGS